MFPAMAGLRVKKGENFNQKVEQKVIGLIWAEFSAHLWILR